MADEAVADLDAELQALRKHKSKRLFKFVITDFLWWLMS